MSQVKCTLKSRKYKHITERERYEIEVLLKESVKPSGIAKRLDRDQRTIEREIIRGTVRLRNTDWTYRDTYCADTAQCDYNAKAKNKGPHLKIGNDHELVKHIEDKIIKEKYSPDAVIGEIHAKKHLKKYQFKTSISTKTLYNYIDQGLFLKLSNKDLPVKRNKKKGQYRKVKIAHKNLKGTSIEKRPEEVDTRETYGHWEMDCVEGNRSGSGVALLVLSERKSREQIIYKMPDQTQKSVLHAMDDLEKRYSKSFCKTFQTITVDNGSEFLDFKGLERSVYSEAKRRTKVYYAHPYSAWERGTNENSNKLIRRFIPKGTDIAKFSRKIIAEIQDWMNNYPRKIFNYKTANDIVNQEVYRQPQGI